MVAKNQNRRPGDLILDRYMPNATVEEREAARANLYALLATLIRIEERRLYEGSGQLDSRKYEGRDRVQHEANSLEI
jgi:hypothetical protein